MRIPVYRRRIRPWKQRTNALHFRRGSADAGSIIIINIRQYTWYTSGFMAVANNKLFFRYIKRYLPISMIPVPLCLFLLANFTIVVGVCCDCNPRTTRTKADVTSRRSLPRPTRCSPPRRFPPPSLYQRVAVDDDHEQLGTPPPSDGDWDVL